MIFSKLISTPNRSNILECYVTADVPPVYADKMGIERVVINLLSNAIKYTDVGGKIYFFILIPPFISCIYFTLVGILIITSVPFPTSLLMSILLSF